MTWRRRLITALAVCAVTLAGSAGCSSRAAQGEDDVSPSPVGRLLDERDEEGRHYREVDEGEAPEVGVEVAPDSDGGWDVRLRVRNFRFSPDGTGRRAVAGRGLAHLEVNGRRVALLRTPEYHLSGGLVPRGTHKVTARLYADDGSVWAVDGKPVESTADITVSQEESSADPSVEPLAATAPPGAVASGASVSRTSVFGTPMFGVPMFGTSVSGVPVPGAVVSGAPVFGTPMAGAPMSRAAVSGVSVSGAPVSGVSVSGAPVSGAPVSGTAEPGVADGRGRGGGRGSPDGAGWA